MGIFKSFKNMLGFSDADIEQEINGDDTARDATVTPLNQRRRQAEATEAAQQTRPQASAPADAQQAPDVPSAAPEAIFRTVVAVFNESMPAFIRESLDEEAQCRYLHNALDESMKKYIADLESAVELRSRLAWAAERERITREVETMRDKTRRIEENSADMKEQKLSAERQKRALAERLHDLESKIASLEAEKEQFDLENKSLMNKLRVVTAHDGADSEELRNALEEANTRNAALLEDIEAMKKRCEISDQMLNDLNHKASAAKAAETEVETQKARIAELEEQLRIASQELETKGEEIANANEQLNEAHEAAKLFEETLNKFEEVKESKNSTIAKQRAEIESLKSTIENNLRAQAESETALREEIERLKRAAEEPKPAPAPKHRHKPEPLPIDDDLDDTNWLVSTPPEGTNARPFGVSDEEFGYQEPKRKPTHDNPDQMRLFDF